MIRVVISPFNVLNFPEGGGHFWVYMQYALGLRQLGCEVYWLEQFCGSGSEESDVAMLRRFQARMERFGMGRKLLLYRSDSYDNPGEPPREYAGLSRAEAEAIFERTDLLLNFHYAMAPGLLSRFRRTALVDIDPGLLQFWISRGQLQVPRHDLYFTTGETVGTPRALFPDCGLNWIRIRPPVSLERWPFSFDPGAEAFTTISNWDADDWIVDAHESYENTKRVAFLKFAQLPRGTGQPLELALFLRTRKDARERRQLEDFGWRVVRSCDVAGTPEAYQKFIQGSRGEFSCVKPSCVRFRNAWISDRTLCYLASGKPVVVQDTGPSAFLPDGEGMFRFRALSEAVLALDAINHDYARHCRAARQIAESFFDARQVGAKILSEALGSSKPFRARNQTKVNDTEPMKTPVTFLPDQATLAAHLTAVLNENGSCRERVEIIDRKQPRMMSTFPNEMVTCRLPRGRTIRVFIKYQGGQGHVAYGHRGNVAYEAEVYLSGLRPLADFRPRCLGAHRDNQTGETWLMMEYLDRCIRVSDLSLREERLVPTMLQATRWLGQFHAVNEARAESGGLCFLTRYDAAYYRGWARRTYELASPLLPRFPWLHELCERCDEWISLLLSPPQTFIHGELYSKHLLLRRNRLFCIDWESAALAPGEIDLATLTEGKGWPAELARSWEQEYRRARWPEGAPSGFERTLDAARMYLHFRWLGERPEWTLAQKYLWRYEHLHAAATRVGLFGGPPVGTVRSGGAL